jgi:hypothetical protein
MRENDGREGTSMTGRMAVGSMVLALALCLPAAISKAQHDNKYPDWKGQWVRIGGGQYDPSKPGGVGQAPPLTPEYKAVWEGNIAGEATGSQEYNPQARCLPGGMPRMMMAYEPMEVIILPDITYIHITFNSEFRRIYTDGRDWPQEIEPSFSGYSIGKWVDEDGDGKFDVLEVETRNMKGPRSFDASGLPLHVDNDSVVKERIYLDKSNRDVLIDEVTTIDKALTQPWTVTKKYVREKKNVIWFEYNCTENNRHVQIGKDNYYVSADGFLMPVRKGQAPPDLKYFKDAQQ